MFAHSFIYLREIPFQKQPACILYWDSMVTGVTTKATGCLYPATQGQASQESRSQLQGDLLYKALVFIVLEKWTFSW